MPDDVPTCGRRTRATGTRSLALATLMRLAGILREKAQRWCALDSGAERFTHPVGKDYALR